VASVLPSVRISSAAAAATPGVTQDVPVNLEHLFGMADAILRVPHAVLAKIHDIELGYRRLTLLGFLGLAMTGCVMASFSGGWQYLAVPVKLIAIAGIGLVLCLPSLYIFACLSNATYALRDVAVAFALGLCVQTMLLCGLAPVAWVFSQSTNSVAFMGALYVTMFFASNVMALGVTQRLLVDGVRPVRHFWVWRLLFTVVILQLSTTLRPIVGPYRGVTLAPKAFFLEHWVNCTFH
jgi:hypothetical protein